MNWSFITLARHCPAVFTYTYYLANVILFKNSIFKLKYWTICNVHTATPRLALTSVSMVKLFATMARLACRNLFTHGNRRHMSECTGQWNHQLSQNRFGYTGSKQVSSSDIAPMGIEDVPVSVQNIHAGKYIANMGIKVVSASVKNVLAVEIYCTNGNRRSTANVHNILAGKYIANMGVKVVSAGVQNVLACKHLLHPWE